MSHRSAFSSLAVGVALAALLSACASTPSSSAATTATPNALPNLSEHSATLSPSSVAHKPKILAIESFRTGAQVVPLPITQDAQGVVCVNYVANASMDAHGHVVAELQSFCQPGHPVQVTDKAGSPTRPGIALPELYAIETFTSGGLSVQLPKTVDAKGVVCQGYVSSTTRSPDGELRIRTSQYCAPAARNAKGEPIATPQDLLGIQTISHGDLSWQHLMLAK